MNNMENILKLEEKLKKQSNVRMDDINKNEIDNIQIINIDSEKPSINRILDFIVYIKNPYFIKVGDTIVKMEFSKNKVKAENCVEQLFCTLYLKT